MKRRDAFLALAGMMAVVFALLAGFAVELANTQAKNKHDVESRVHERSVLAGALIDSLFNSASQSSAQTKLYAGLTVTPATLTAHRGADRYLALYDASGKLLAASAGFSAPAGRGIRRSGVLGLTAAGHPYALGDVESTADAAAVPYATAITTPYGRRTLVSGIAPQVLSSFLTGELEKIPGVQGAHNYLIDGNDTVIASTNPKRPAGYRFRQPGQLRALAARSGDRNGRYYDTVALANSPWRVILTAPDGPLFASVNGLRKWVPWAIFIAFALTAMAVLGLLRRLLSTADRLRGANLQSASLNRQLAETNAELQHRAVELARSNADLEHFASIASHDLQEPLRKVRTYTQRLTETEAEHLSEKGVEYLGRANRSAERMQQLIEDLLRYSRVATHGRAFTSVDLDALSREVLDDLSAQVERTGAQITLDGLPTVIGDEPQLRQLLQNLLSNAMKFHREGVAPEVSVHGAMTASGVSVTVSDNGIGFEPQYRQRIFRIFERLNGRSDYPGTGIGLALCRKIAERHGGDVIADSTPGQGSTFTVLLPSAAPERTSAPESAPAREVVNVG